MARTRSANIGGMLITANGMVSSSGVDLASQANAAYSQANSAYGQANAAYNAANNAQVTVYQNSSSSITTQKINFVNTSTITVSVSADASNANVAFTAVGGAAYDQANSAYAQANLAYAAANNSNLKSGGIISGTLNVTNDIIVGGNVYLQGNTTFINVSTYQVNDPLMYIAANNILTDSVDIGFIGAKNTSGTFSHTGLARDATDGKYKLFDGLPDNDHIGNVINFANTYLATLVANVEANTLRVVNSVTGNVNFDSGTLFVDSVNDRVGVGTTTPSYKLHVAGTGYISGNFTSGGIIETLTTVQSSSGSDLSLNANGANRDVFFKVNNSTLAIVQGSTGNFGVGTASPSSKLSVGGNPPLSGILAGVSAANGISLALSDNVNNSFYVKHVAGGAATIGTDSGGQLAFATNGFTERMRIDSSGNVGIGTASPVTRLHVLDALSGGQLIIANSETNAAEKYGTFATQHYTNAQSPALGMAVQSNSTDNNILIGGALGEFNAATTVRFYTAANNTTTTGTERMRITSSGNVGIGTASPQQKLHISGTDGIGFGGSASDKKLYSPLDGDLEWMTHNAASGKGFAVSHQGTKYVYLSVSGVSYLTGGNVGIGTTSPNYKLEVIGGRASVAASSEVYSLGVRYNSTTGNFWIGATNSGTPDVVFSNAFGTEICRMFNAGGFSVGTTTSPGTGAIYATGEITAFYSDDRLKNKLGNIDNALSKVLTLNGFYYEPNETAMNLGYEKKKQVGVSAQEVQEVLPEVVVAAPIDAEYMTVHYHKLVPLLIEAIKELNTKIEDMQKIIESKN